MLVDRLRIALDRGLVTLPDAGRIAVLGATAADDLSDLPADRTDVVQRHFPDHKAALDRGFAAVTEATGPYALSIICLPRAKADARARIAAARAVTNGPLVIDGAKTDGVDSILKSLRGRADIGDVLSKAHGKLFTVSGGDFTDWIAAATETADGFSTAPGVFSADGVDPGSAALAELLPDRLAGHVVDLGAGWGYLAARALTRPGITRLDLVEADHAALEAARRNITDPRATFHWTDARTWVSEARVDHVISNPPFHTGRAGDTALGQAFISAAARLLKPSGTLWLVANRHLPYERSLEDAFGEVRELDGPRSYKIFAASRPRHRSPKG